MEQQSFLECLSLLSRLVWILKRMSPWKSPPPPPNHLWVKALLSSLDRSVLAREERDLSRWFLSIAGFDWTTPTSSTIISSLVFLSEIKFDYGCTSHRSIQCNDDDPTERLPSTDRKFRWTNSGRWTYTRISYSPKSWTWLPWLQMRIASEGVLFFFLHLFKAKHDEKSKHRKRHDRSRSSSAKRHRHKRSRSRSRSRSRHHRNKHHRRTRSRSPRRKRSRSRSRSRKRSPAPRPNFGSSFVGLSLLSSEGLRWFLLVQHRPVYVDVRANEEERKRLQAEALQRLKEMAGKWDLSSSTKMIASMCCCSQWNIRSLSIVDRWSEKSDWCTERITNEPDSNHCLSNGWNSKTRTCC